MGWDEIEKERMERDVWDDVRRGAYARELS